MSLRQNGRRPVVPIQSVFAETIDQVRLPSYCAVAFHRGQRPAFEVHEDRITVADGGRVAA
ncbi:hypothetical protein [Stieleria magnilauensis]|uniref:hypothetical protein n=1 Tax=Stieleria magnilauensis TaxID=2527963 RepID=UPI003AF58EE6